MNMSSTPSIQIIEGLPGSGKTQTAIKTAIKAFQNGKRVIFATNSNTQSFDIARRIKRKNNHTRVVLYHRSTLQIPQLLKREGIHLATGTSLFMEGPCIVLGNAAKWAWVKAPIPHFDLMIIDDASTLRESLFMQIAGLANQFLIIHSAIPNNPIVRSGTERWEHMNHAPHRSIVQTIPRYTHLSKNAVQKQQQTHSYRLPQDTIDILYPHVFPLSITTEKTTRRLEIPNITNPLWQAVDAGKTLVMQHIQNASSEAKMQWVAKSMCVCTSTSLLLSVWRIRAR